MGIKKTVNYAPGTAASEWALRTSGFGAANIESIIYANNLYLAGGVGGILRTSTNSISWTQRTSGFGTTQINILTYVNGLYVAGGTFGKLTTSTDTIVWEQRTSGFGSTQIQSIIYANNLYLAGGENGVLSTSTDAIVWTYRTSSIVSDNSSLVYGNGIYILTSSNLVPSPILTSTDTIVWTQRTSGLSGSPRIYFLTYTNNLYLAGGQSGILTTSTNGIVWTQRTSGFGTTTINTLTYNNNLYVSGGTFGTLTISTDSIVWELRTSGFDTSTINVLTYANNLFVAGGDSGTLTTSPGADNYSVLTTGLAFVNGNRITGITSTTDDDDVASKSYADSQLPDLNLTGNEGKFYTTTDGINTSWDYVSNTEEFTTPGAQSFTVPNQANLLYVEAVGAGAGGGAGATGLIGTSSFGSDWIVPNTPFGMRGPTAYANGLYVMGNDINTNNGIIVSTDTIVWTFRTSGFNEKTQSLISVDNQFYLVMDAVNAVYAASSTDSIVWTLRTAINTGFTPRWTFNYGGGYFIIGDNGGTIQASTDCIVWQLRTSGTGLQMYGSTYDGSKYYLTGANRVSTDTIHWVGGNFGLGSGSINDIFYGNNLYVVCSWTITPGRIATSTDAQTWELRTSGQEGRSLYSISYGGGYYFVGGEAGRIIRSTDTIVWEEKNIGINQTVEDIKYLNNAVYAYGTISPSVFSGKGGSAGAYTSWYIPKNILGTTLTVTPGTGGTGGTTDGELGSAGSDTTISWTGPNAQTYTITASSTAANTVSSSSSFYTTAGTDGAIVQYISSSSGNDGTSQTEKFQPTGGGSGAVDSGTGGSGGSISVYGNSISAVGGYDADTATLTGQNATLISGLPYGNGGGGGGSSAGAVWTLRTSGFGTLNTTVYSSLVDNNNYYLGGQGYFIASTDTIVWSKRTLSINQDIFSISKSIDTYVVGGNSGYNASSTDSIIWISRTSGFGTTTIRSLTYGNNLYLAAGGGGTLTTSTDAIVWTRRTSGFGNEIHTLGYVNGIYIFGGFNGTPFVSTDTIVWSARTSFFGSYYSVAYGNNNYVLFGSAGNVISSTDTIIWSNRTSRYSGTPSGIKYSNGFIVVASNTIVTSTDSIVWTLRTASGTGALRTVNGQSNLIIGGNDGRIETSEPIPASGGNGVRGGGGGGGAVYSTSFGNGGNGGDGYVKITWW